MLTKFRKNHLSKIFSQYENAPPEPIDAFLNRYLRRNKAIGSNDRKVIGDVIYTLIRYQGLIDVNLGKSPTWEDRLNFFYKHKISEEVEKAKYQAHERASFPKDFYQLLVEVLGEAKAIEFCKNSNEPAPIMIRVNALKTSRESLLKAWSKKYDVSPCEFSENGIIFHKKINFFVLPEFQKGLFEVQDEASQLVSSLPAVKPGDKILDYCAGAGGKSLCIAPRLKGKGQIYLHDIREKPLISAKKRLKRAGVQNCQIICNDPKRLQGLKNNMDLVIADVPCSGSGTWRRNPDQKWKFSLEMLDRIQKEQREIFTEALQYAKPKGQILYATCSVLPQENQNQIDFFTKELHLKVVGEPFSSLPKPGKMDGFFAAVLKKKDT